MDQSNQQKLPWRCRSIHCTHNVPEGEDFCAECQDLHVVTGTQLPLVMPDQPVEVPTSLSLADLYPKYYKKVGALTEIDVYAVHKLFDIQDPSGAIQHASKKLLLSGARTGGKSKVDDIREARDTLNRWLQLHG